MKNKLFSITLCSLLAASSLSAVVVEQGWGMYGFGSDVNLTQTFGGQSDVSILWSYDATTMQWKAYSPNASINDKLSQRSDIVAIDKLGVGEGCWILNSGTGIIDTDSVATEATDLQRSLAGTIANSSEGLANASGVAANATSGAANATSSLPSSTTSAATMARVLYDYATPPPFEVSGDGSMQMTMTDVVGTTDAMASLKFTVNGNDVNASHIMDSTGEAYGLSTMETTMTSLGAFFSNFPQDQTAVTYVQNNIESLYGAVGPIIQAPLFSIVGDGALQDFFTNFPTPAIPLSTDLTTAIPYWTTQATNFMTMLGTDGSSLDTAINFNAIEYMLAVEFTEPLEVGGYNMDFPALVSESSPLTNVMNMDSNVTMIFHGDGNGTVLIPDATATLSNIDVNVTMDLMSMTPSAIGKYDIRVEKDGHVYTGTPTFNVNGCLGADIYEGTEFISRMKIFDDGLWIVDQANVKIEKVQ